MSETVRFMLVHPNGTEAISAALAGDLANVVMAQSGVAGIQINRQSGMVEIEYDPDFVAPAKLHSYLTDAGYGVQERTSGE